MESFSPGRSSSRQAQSPSPSVAYAGDSSVLGAGSGLGGSSSDKGKNGASSTGVEVKTDEQDAAIERHSSTHPFGSNGQSSQVVSGASDVESQTTTGAGAGRLPRQSNESDPYGLSSAYKTDLDLEEIRPSGSRKRNTGRVDSNDGGVVAGEVATSETVSGTAAGVASGHGNNTSDSGLLARCLPASMARLTSLSFARAPRRALQTRRLKGFYKSQNAAIERMLKSVEEHQAEARQEQGDDQLKYRIAVYGSFVANIILAILQIYGAVSSRSLSLFTTMADSIFDPMSNITLILTNRAVKRVDPARFPSGKARLETVGNIVFCFLMIAVSFILVAFSIQELVERHGEDSKNRFHLPSVIAVAIAFCTKLVLFFYTWALKDKYSQANILWQDHRNDLLINGFGILTSVGGSKLVWWIDPMGAIVLSVVVATVWLHTAFSEFLLLVGVVASVETQQLITYVCVTHSPAVRQIDTVRVYHSGPRLIAEVDVVMERNATLAETHDVAEALQSKLECLPDIERAYVHVDYETTHKPEHALKKDI
ncbi:cation efflux family protein [Grosmannia clavigera kw1407]|uniref:Cation efflux family protein n=1 Tax=Grosmannia clavigera (strain kw1407 / UAMH 11150) TaxID=655863 RepID=F0XM78_GROCL|nr:cation efflux family protein [Grosmannia clavigera kw1407]EFX01373.1 cation efflux family protein [Grosmannia clavigera kw1407]